MDILGKFDWREMWVPSGSVLEVFVRGTIMYLGLVVLFRVLRRDTGSLSLADLLVVVLIADAAQNAMAGEYRSLTEGFVLVATIAFWNYLLNWLSFHFRPIGRLLQPPPLPLIRNGVIQRANLRKELITPDELASQLRQQGIDRFEDVETCCLEPDGQISVIKGSGESQPKKK